MLIYEGTKYDFKMDMDLDKIPHLLEEKLYERMHIHTSKKEVTSWKNSLQYMYKVLNDPTIPDTCGVATEYNIPKTNKRVDFIMSGYNHDGKASAIIIELKQWERVETVFNREDLINTEVMTALGKGVHRVVHPCYQAWSYVQHMNDYIEEVGKKDIQLYPCAYLHNYDLKKEQNIINPIYNTCIEKSPLFTQGEIPRLREFIKKHLKQGDRKEVLFLIENGRIRPSKSLQDCISSMLDGNQVFTMLDTQKVVYEEILYMAKLCQKDKRKRVMIAKGGSGTGKSVIAVNAMVNLLKEDMFGQYITKNAAPRNVYIDRLAGKMKKNKIKSLFAAPDKFYQQQPNDYDFLIVDEAHRLREKSGMFQKGENQIQELISSSLFTVFFIDPYQRVHFRDFGSISEFQKQAQLQNAEVIQYELHSQFRCNGSDGYLAWIRNMLQLEETANFNFKDISFDFRVIDDPNELRAMICEKNDESGKARILAGYCWEWEKAGRSDPNHDDIVIGDFKMSWNLDAGDPYAISQGSVHQVGCIHTTQGLEFDYVGVIIGEDLRYENNELVTDYRQRAKTDSSVKGLKKLYRENPEKAKHIERQIILNTYYTLMTRGMKGCYIYCCDSELQKYIKMSIADA